MPAFQIAATVIGLLIGITQLAKESMPYIEMLKPNAPKVQQKAAQIASMNINWQYRGSDNVWHYYSDANNQYWCRTNSQGVYEYTERPVMQAYNNQPTYK